MSTSREPMIRVEDVTIAYGDRVVLSGVSFEVLRGEVFVILGGSGCGKSSLVKDLIGLRSPRAGRILIDGRDVTTAEGAEGRAILRSFGVMYQSGALFGSLTVHENVRLPLDELTDLSEGQKDALALGPPLVFLDEPSAGLDPVTSAGLDALIADLARSSGTTFVVVTHELQNIFAIADRCVMLDAARRTLVAEGRPSDLRDTSNDPQVLRFFRRGAEEPAPGRSLTA